MTTACLRCRGPLHPGHANQFPRKRKGAQGSRPSDRCCPRLWLQAALDYTRNEWLIVNLVGEAKTRLRGVKWRWPTLPPAILLTNRIGGHGPASVARRCRSEYPVLRQTCAPGAAAVTASLTTIMPGFDSRCRHLRNT